MNEISQALLLKDQAEDIAGLIRGAEDAVQHPDALAEAVRQLIVAGHLRPAYVAAMVLGNLDRLEPGTALTLALGGLQFGNAAEAERGLSALRAQVDTLDAGQQAAFYTEVLEPVMLERLLEMLSRADQGHAMAVLEVLKAGAPRFRTVFDFDAPVPALTPEAVRKLGQGRPRPVAYPSPPVAARRRPRRVVVAVRELFFPDRPESRPLDLGPRLVAALDAYGWNTRFCGMACRNFVEDYGAVARACIEHDAEVLILDDNLLEFAGADALRAQVVAWLRRELPALKLVSILFDSWVLTPAMVAALADADCVWETTSPSLPLWREPAFAGRVLHMQVPHAGNDRPPVAPLRPSLSFCGSVKGFNWHRTFWLASAIELGLPVERRMSTHRADGLPALESYAAYMRRLADSPCALNLSMRSDQSCIVTGRCFETIVSGSLLVQEATPDMDHYFIAGEHYLPFSTIAELRAVIRFIEAYPEAAAEIRRRGNAFARARYSDDRLIGYLDKRLFFTPP